MKLFQDDHLLLTDVRTKQSTKLYVDQKNKHTVGDDQLIKNIDGGFLRLRYHKVSVPFFH